MIAGLQRPALIYAAALALVAFRADLPPQLLPVYGGGGGTAFTRSCGQGYVLTGLRYRMGATFDAAGVLCRPVLSDGALGPETTVGTLAGGGGGTSKIINCPTGQVVDGGSVFFATYVGELTIFCRPWHSGSRTFSGTETSADTGHDLQPFKTLSGEFCESASQPAHGIRGRAGTLLDAIGLICDEP
jgi:hypothetical protein